ncbi:MAG TPA: hypothetical protein VMA09_17410 [Candidatus Binataceae bacterium]|nr:hypothetical protein [Candidatus Binataceae bacterium]
MFDLPRAAQSGELAKIPFSGGIIGGQQTLDGALWRNVTLIKMHIIYRGGPLMLSNVKFIDCTFTFARGDNAAVLANYVALGSYSLTLS